MEESPKQQVKLRIVLFLCFLLAIQAVHCDPIPELVVKKSDENENIASNKPDMSQKLKCMWEAYTAMVTGDDSSIKNECLLLFSAAASSSENEDGQIEKKKSREEQLNPSKQLDDLTMQLREIDADYKDAMENQKETKTSPEDGDQTSKNDNNLAEIANNEMQNSDIIKNQRGIADAALTAKEIDSPFVTSVKEFNEDFLVIPFNYLKSQFNGDEEEQRNLADLSNQLKMNENKSNQKEMKLKKERLEKKLTKKSQDDSKLTDNENNKNLEQILSELQSGNEQSDKNVEVLRQVKSDINRLEDDLKSLESTDQ